MVGQALKKQAKIKEDRVLLLMLTLYSGLYSVVGATFVSNMYGFLQNFLHWLLLMSLIFSFSSIFSLIFFKLWYTYTVDSSNRWNDTILKPLIEMMVLSVIYVAIIRLITGMLSWKTVVLSLLKVDLFIAILYRLKKVSETPEIYSRRRIRLMIPWIYGVLEPALFGSASILSLVGGKVSFVLYGIPLLYYLLWCLSLRYDSRDVKVINGLVCILVVGVLSLLLYLITLNPSDYHISYIVAVKASSLSVGGLGILGIPGLVEMAQVLRHDGLGEDDTESLQNHYREIMQILSVVDLFSVVLFHFAFTYLDIPFIYFGVYALFSIIWVFIARSHYECKIDDPYNGSYIISVLYPAVSAFCVLSCILDIIPRPNIDLQITPQIAYFSAVFHFIADGIALIGFGVKLNFYEIKENAWRLRLIGYRTLGLFITEILLLFSSLLGIGNNRTNVMMLLLTGEMLFQCIFYFLFYSKKRFQE